MFQYWPLPVRTGLIERRINLSRLSPVQKSELWSKIQTENKDLADLLIELKANEFVQSLIRDMGAEIEIYEIDFSQKAGLE